MKKYIIWALFLAIVMNAKAQKSDGTVKSLVKADNAFSAKAKTDGIIAAYQSFAAEDGIVFRPNAINSKTYYASGKDTKTYQWTPDFARVSRSRNWGVTSGYFNESQDKNKVGRYFNIWRDTDDKWKCIINIQTETIKPIKGKEAAQNFVEPKDTYQPKFASKKDLKVGADIIASTEKILNTMFKTYGVSAFAGFLNHDATLVFPGTDFIQGKNEILAFNNRMIDKINLRNVQTDKALGGDYAYTYGLATIDYKTDLRESFNYLFIWQRQTDANWNIIAEIFTLAER